MEGLKNGVKVVWGRRGWMGEDGEEMGGVWEEEGKRLLWWCKLRLGVGMFGGVKK